MFIIVFAVVAKSFSKVSFSHYTFGYPHTLGLCTLTYPHTHKLPELCTSLYCNPSLVFLPTGFQTDAMLCHIFSLPLIKILFETSSISLILHFSCLHFCPLRQAIGQSTCIHFFRVVIIYCGKVKLLDNELHTFSRVIKRLTKCVIKMECRLEIYTVI